MPPVSMTAEGSAASRLPLGMLIAHHASCDPHAPLLTINDDVIDRASFEARCNRRARMLRARGVSQDDIVTIALSKGLEFYETIFAIWKLGATPNPISAALSNAEIERLLTVVRPRLVIGLQPGQAGTYPALGSLTEISADHSAEPLTPVVARYWKAMTSGGSTGRPKLIVDHMPGTWDPAEGGLGQRPGETILNAGPLYHNGPFLAASFALFTGGHVVEMMKFDASAYLSMVSQHRVNWGFLVPTMMLRIARLAPEVRRAADLSSLRLMLHSASPCPVWLKRFWIEWIGPERVSEIYTGTERQGTFVITGEEWLARPGSVGRIQPGSSVRIVAENGQNVSAGEVGEIYLRHDGETGAAYHYLGAEPRLLDNWESLGDLGRLDEDGYLFLSDRRLDLIIRGGVNIYPAEIEAALESHPAVASAAVIGLPDEDLGETVHAIVQLSAGCRTNDTDLRDHVSNHLSYYKIPRTFEFTESALRDEAGKMRRSALRASRVDAAVRAANPEGG